MEVYGLQDNGVPLASSQADITPIQRFVYVMAKDYHTEDVDAEPPSDVSGAHNATRGL